MKRVLFGLITTMIALPLLAQTAPSRVAVINVQEVLQESEAGKEALGRLDTIRGQKAATIQRMESQLRELESKFSPSLSAERRQELEQEIGGKRLALQRFAQDAERELGAERDQTLAALESQILPLISEVGKEMGFAAIFNKFESGLVYASDAIDITDIIIRRFNESTAGDED